MPRLTGTTRAAESTRRPLNERRMRTAIGTAATTFTKVAGTAMSSVFTRLLE
ncbi:hypothetical protein GCM10029964_126150 [Kibdelosporangium lantanae]